MGGITIHTMPSIQQSTTVNVVPHITYTAPCNRPRPCLIRHVKNAITTNALTRDVKKFPNSMEHKHRPLAPYVGPPLLVLRGLLRTPKSVPGSERDSKSVGGQDSAFMYAVDLRSSPPFPYSSPFHPSVSVHRHNVAGIHAHN